MKSKIKLTKYESFEETLLDEYTHTFFEYAPGDVDGKCDPFIRFTIKTLFDSGVKSTVEMMRVILPMLDERKDHLDRLNSYY